LAAPPSEVFGTYVNSLLQLNSPEVASSQPARWYMA
jgi:hypothetical protein